MRKLSDMLIEIAMQGLESPKDGHSEVMYALMFLAHVAWNRDTKSPDYLEDHYREQLIKFPASGSRRREKLISNDWGKILKRMIDYKRARFPDDNRVITMYGYTPRDTLRVEWE